jgi:hypothetical protein
MCASCCSSVAPLTRAVCNSCMCLVLLLLLLCVALLSLLQVKYVEESGRFEVDIDKKPRTYTDLSEIIADQSCLKRLYPNMPKAEALLRLAPATATASATASATGTG